MDGEVRNKLWLIFEEDFVCQEALVSYKYAKIIKSFDKSV